MKLLAIDGNSIVNRAFYGIRMLNAPDGTPTNGIYGFLTILRRLLDDEKPDGLCVTFDLRAPTFRHLRYDGYKAQRKGMPSELAVQMPLLKETLDAMGILRMEKEGYEADDLLGTISRRCSAAGHECVIVTGDKDSLQLIGDNTRVLHVKTRMGQTDTVNYTRQRFEEEYGFEPVRMIDLKALMGDASDNIPGVPGVGEKTAMELLHRYGSLEGVYAAIDAPELKEGVRKKLREGESSARMSYELATIVTDAPIELDLKAAHWDHNSIRPELYDIFMRLGFTKFIEKYHLTPPGGREEAEKFEGECVIENVLTAEDLRSAMKKIGDDTVYIMTGDALELVIFQGGNGCTAWALDKEQFRGDYSDALRTLFASPLKKAGHNIKDTMRELLELGIESANWVFDSALAAYLLDATAGSYDIDRLCMKYCNFRPWTDETEEESGQMSLLDVPDAAIKRGRLASYGAAVACLEEKMLPLLRERGAEELFFRIELPLCAVLADMEHTGFLVDREALRDFGESMTGTIDRLQQSIWDMAGERFNINSPKQLGHILFEKLMLPSGKKTKTGWSTGADILEKLRDKHPIVNEVLEFRTLTKLKSTYADGLLKMIGLDGRIHTSFQMTVTATGRLSSTEPNLQNIPIRKEFGAQIRKMFVAPPGMVLVDADYSQIELRLLAHISGDENMIGAFRNGEDIHTVTASQVFDIPPEAVTPLLRSRAKAVNFGIVYGISAWSLAQDIDVPPNDAKAYMDAYLEKYHGVREYQHNIVEQAKRDGCVFTLFGRRRELPELRSGSFAMRAFGERVALNMPIQGTAADVIKLAMVNVYTRLKSEGLHARLILQVHDELIAECPADEAEAVKEILCREMENAASFSVPLTVDAGVGVSWAEAH